jgi:signal transduction histidine kinase
VPDSSALKYLFADFEKYHELKISVDMDDINNLFPSQAEILMYRILQESLNNVAKYAEATQISASIKKVDDSVSFILEDNGKGFNVEEALSRDISKRGLGLAALLERVRMLGGTLQIKSQEGVGTRISFNIPIHIVS